MKKSNFLGMMTSGVIFLSLFDIYSNNLNSLNDSSRDKESLRYENSSNLTKRIIHVDTSYSKNKIYSPTFNGFNPKVKYNITFNDSSKTELKYTKAPSNNIIIKAIRGNEFEPRVGQTYKVSLENIIVKEIND